MEHAAMAKKPLKPGEPVIQPGQYEEVGPRGGRTGHEVTMPEGHKLPPTSRTGGGFILVDPSKNKAGRRKK
jgi:hypothetical protein